MFTIVSNISIRLVKTKTVISGNYNEWILNGLNDGWTFFIDDYTKLMNSWAMSTWHSCHFFKEWSLIISQCHMKSL